jgi:hypothetical protein
MRTIKGYNDFLNEEKGFLKNALIGGVIAASSIPNTVNANTPVGNEPVVPVEVSDTSVVNKDINKSLESLIDTISTKNPQLVIDEKIESKEPIDFNNNNAETLSFLERNLTQFNSNLISNKLPKLSLSDLDLLSKPGLPFKINYYMVQIISDEVKLMPILNINYSEAINIHKHEVRFNLTRMNGVNSFGATINF